MTTCSQSIARTLQEIEAVGNRIWDAGKPIWTSPLCFIVADEAEVLAGRPLMEICLAFGDCSTEVHVYDLGTAAQHLAERLRAFAAELLAAGMTGHARRVLAAAGRIETVV